MGDGACGDTEGLTGVHGTLSEYHVQKDTHVEPSVALGRKVTLDAKASDAIDESESSKTRSPCRRSGAAVEDNESSC